MWVESFANRPDEGETAMEPLTHFQEDVLADLLQSLHLYTRKRQNSEADLVWRSLVGYADGK
jgi:hypothetical protein